MFDVSTRLLVVDVEDGAEAGRNEVVLKEAQFRPRARRLTALGVDVLICGAISNGLEQMLVSAGVRVIGHSCGMVGDVLEAFISGRLTGRAFLMPGCQRRDGP